MDWELLESGPADADRTVLLLPGGMSSARSYKELMAEPSLGAFRLVAATLPGQAGAPSPDDYSNEAYGRVTAELVAATGADVVVGFSMGANVALEMVEKKLWTGPTVLLGISLSLPDEAGSLVNLVRLSKVLGPLPLAMMKRAASTMVRGMRVSPARRAELADDFRKNRTSDMRPELNEYLAWLKSDEDHAVLLCASGVPTWVVHAEKGGDGGLTDSERRTLEACPTVRVVTIPGKVFFLPNEAPEPVAAVITEAVAATR